MIRRDQVIKKSRNSSLRADKEKPARVIHHTPEFIRKQKALQDLYLKFLAASYGREVWSCQKAGVSYWTVLNWREKDPVFDAKFLKTLEIVPAAARDEAIRRGLEGFPDRPVTYEGEIVREMTQYSDKMLSSVLAAHDPKFRAKGVEDEPPKIIVELANFAGNPAKTPA